VNVVVRQLLRQFERDVARLLAEDPRISATDAVAETAGAWSKLTDLPLVDQECARYEGIRPALLRRYTRDPEHMDV